MNTSEHLLPKEFHRTFLCVRACLGSKRDSREMRTDSFTRTSLLALYLDSNNTHTYAHVPSNLTDMRAQWQLAVWNLCSTSWLVGRGCVSIVTEKGSSPGPSYHMCTSAVSSPPRTQTCKYFLALARHFLLISWKRQIICCELQNRNYFIWHLCVSCEVSTNAKANQSQFSKMSKITFKAP